MAMIFDQLSRAGVIKRNQLQEDVLAEIDFGDLLDLIDQISQHTSEAPEANLQSAYTFSSSIQLGGGRGECMALECRLRRIDEVARFAALYGDRVYLHNFLTDHSPSLGHPPETDTIEFREEIAKDIILLLHVQPLIKEGIVIPFTPPSKYCPYHFAEHAFGDNAAELLDRARNQISEEIAESLTVELGWNQYCYTALLTGVEDIVGHDRHWVMYDDLPEFLESQQDIVHRIDAGEKINLTPEQIREFQFHRRIASIVFGSVIYQMAASTAIGASYLTHRDLDLRLLASITANEGIERRNSLSASNLRALVPFGDGVPITELVKLRKREEDSFVRFRAALTDTIHEFQSSSDAFSKQQARELYSDVMAPSVAKLNQRVEEAKRDLLKKPLSSAIGVVAALGFGIYSGLLPDELSGIASVLGLSKVVLDTASKLVELVDVQKAIRPEEFYFLWKVKHLSRDDRLIT